MTEPAESIQLTVDRVPTGDSATRVTKVRMTGGDDDAHPADRDTRRDFVLVAGVGVAATYFEFLAPTLAERGDVYALDLPGFAGMPRPHEQPTAEYFADQVERVLQHYDLVNPVLIGHSMGTQVVTEVLRRHPEFTHAVLVSPVINEAERSVGVQAVRFTQSAAHESVHLALTAFSAYLLCGLVYFLTVLPHMMRYRLGERLGMVQASLLLIRGELDRTSPRRFHSRLARLARDARTWEIEEAAHSIINGHAIGVASLTTRLIDGDLPRRGRMPDSEARLPPARHSDLAMLLSAAGSRAAEWVSALRGDDRGVARAKAAHAKLLF
ncbi:MAG: alpha/beta fold hydrolase, partial [Herbiconiux sp.]|nr:alpha/beta fold hydrolase [Herbiconiux sp.]